MLSVPLVITGQPYVTPAAACPLTVPPLPHVHEPQELIVEVARVSCL
jgi:hypothetical protein